MIERDLEIVETVDWIIELGPEGSTFVDEIVAVGTPEKLAQEPQRYTGRVSQAAARAAG